MQNARANMEGTYGPEQHHSTRRDVLSSGLLAALAYHLSPVARLLADNNANSKSKTSDQPAGLTQTVSQLIDKYETLKGRPRLEEPGIYSCTILDELTKKYRDYFTAEIYGKRNLNFKPAGLLDGKIEEIEFYGVYDASLRFPGIRGRCLEIRMGSEEKIIPIKYYLIDDGSDEGTIRFGFSLALPTTFKVKESRAAAIKEDVAKVLSTLGGALDGKRKTVLTYEFHKRVDLAQQIRRRMDQYIKLKRELVGKQGTYFSGVGKDPSERRGPHFTFTVNVDADGNFEWIVARPRNITRNSVRFVGVSSTEPITGRYGKCLELVLGDTEGSTSHPSLRRHYYFTTNGTIFSRKIGKTKYGEITNEELEYGYPWMRSLTEVLQLVKGTTGIKGLRGLDLFDKDPNPLPVFDSEQNRITREPNNIK